MNEHLKMQARDWLSAADNDAATQPYTYGLVRNLLTECERLSDLVGRAEQPKFNQCAEVCERAKLCAICAGPVSEQPKPEPVAERGWLIERSDCVWWVGIIKQPGEDYAWTRDSNDAIRFSRHKDAFPFLCKLVEQGIDCKVTEHEWIGGDLNRLYTAPPAIPEGYALDVDWLSNVIRTVDGRNELGAGALAEAICTAIAAKVQP